MADMNEIEKLFVHGVEEWLYEYAWNNAYYDKNKYLDLTYGYYGFTETLLDATHLVMIPQYQIGRYRFDFAFLDKRRAIQYAVEIDGHDYHKTKEQRYHDYKRERYLMERDFLVVRFMASEVYQNAKGCADRFIGLARRDADRYNSNSKAYRFLGWVEAVSDEELINYVATHNNWEEEIYKYEPYLLNDDFRTIKKRLGWASGKYAGRILGVDFNEMAEKRGRLKRQQKE